VEYSVPDFGILTGSLPGFIKPLDFIVTLTVQKDIGRHHAAVFPSFPLVVNDIFQLVIEINRPTFVILGFTSFKPYDTLMPVDPSPGKIGNFRQSPSSFISERHEIP